MPAEKMSLEIDLVMDPGKIRQLRKKIEEEIKIPVSAYTTGTPLSIPHGLGLPMPSSFPGSMKVGLTTTPPVGITGDGKGASGMGAIAGGFVAKEMSDLMQTAISTAMGPLKKVLEVVAKLLGLLVMPLVNLVIPALMPLITIMMPFVRMMNMLFRPLFQRMMEYFKTHAGEIKAAAEKGPVEGLAAMTEVEMGMLADVLGEAFGQVGKKVIQTFTGIKVDSSDLIIQITGLVATVALLFAAKVVFSAAGLAVGAASADVVDVITGLVGSVAGLFGIEMTAISTALIMAGITDLFATIGTAIGAIILSPEFITALAIVAAAALLAKTMEVPPATEADKAEARRRATIPGPYAMDVTRTDIGPPTPGGIPLWGEDAKNAANDFTKNFSMMNPGLEHFYEVMNSSATPQVAALGKEAGAASGKVPPLGTNSETAAKSVANFSTALTVAINSINATVARAEAAASSAAYYAAISDNREISDNRSTLNTGRGRTR